MRGREQRKSRDSREFGPPLSRRYDGNRDYPATPLDEGNFVDNGNGNDFGNRGNEFHNQSDYRDHRGNDHARNREEYFRDSSDYNRNNQDYGRNNQDYGHSNQEYNGRNKQDYGRNSREYFRDDRGYNRDARNFDDHEYHDYEYDRGPYNQEYSQRRGSRPPEPAVYDNFRDDGYHENSEYRELDPVPPFNESESMRDHNMKRHHKSRSRSGGSKRSSKKHRSKRTRSRSNDSSGDEWLKLKAKRKAEKANEGTKQWDKPPEGLSELSLQEAALAIKPLMLQATMIAASPQQNRQARRLYVGNITPAAHENQIAQFFNIHLANTGKCFHIPPVSNVQIHIEKAFAFVEFVRVEDATLCMALDGIIFENQKVKIRRPKDYIKSHFRKSVILSEKRNTFHSARTFSIRLLK